MQTRTSPRGIAQPQGHTGSGGASFVSGTADATSLPPLRCDPQGCHGPRAVLEEEAAIDTGTTKRRSTGVLDSAGTSLEDSETTVAHPCEDVENDTYPPPPDDSATPWIHSGWSTTRARVRRALIRVEAPVSRVQRFDYCGRDAFVYGLWNEGQLRDVQVRGSCCRDRFCLVCGRIRSQQWASKVRKVLAGEKPALFITLTMGGNSNEPLAAKLDRLIQGFRALRSVPLWSRRIRGGVGFLEVKWTGKRWHPHLHLIADGDYLDQGQLSDAWRAITGDSFICDIRRVRDANRATQYVAKYASKPLDRTVCASEDHLVEAIRALRGRRLVLTFGKFHGTKLAMTEEEEFDETEALTPWRSIGRVDALIDSAGAGDAFAKFVLAALERKRAASRRDSG